MKMITTKNQETALVTLDASKLPKYYKISPIQYDIDLSNDTNILVSSKNTPIKSMDIEKVVSLIFELSYAAKGYADCEMQLSKFNRLMACFSYGNSEIKDFKF